LITEQYRKDFSIIDIRISNVYGPTHLRRPDIIPSLIWKIKDKKRLSVWNKKPKRDFVYVEDAIEAVLLLMETDFSGPVNLGSGKSISVKEICEILEKLSGKKIYDEKIKVSGHMEFFQDITLLKSIIDWSPKYSINSGLAKTFNEMVN
jgi:nucleoside-diphosphate-sugar epimerase